MNVHNMTIILIVTAVSHCVLTIPGSSMYVLNVSATLIHDL